MLGSGILDFAIGLVFTFLAMSLAAGAATEALSSALKIRSKTLLRGVQDLLNDPELNALAAELYQHALINPRGSGGAGSTSQNPPAYIDPDQFAAAFIEIIKGLPGNAAVQPPGPAAATPPAPAVAPAQRVQQLKAAVDAKLPPGTNDQIRNMLHGIIDRARGDEDEVRRALSSWFDNAMDRVSGAYKRWTQLWSFLLALAIAALLNVSTIDIAQSLWRQPVDTKAMAAATLDTADLPATLDELDKLPIGWPPKGFPPHAQPKQTGTANAVNPDGEIANLYGFFARSPSLWGWTRIFGWVITAFATLFGAPFWFDALQQIVRLKGSGPSPAEKTNRTAAAG